MRVKDIEYNIVGISWKCRNSSCMVLSIWARAVLHSCRQTIFSDKVLLIRSIFLQLLQKELFWRTWTQDPTEDAQIAESNWNTESEMLYLGMSLDKKKSFKLTSSKASTWSKSSSKICLIKTSLISLKESDAILQTWSFSKNTTKNLSLANWILLRTLSKIQWDDSHLKLFQDWIIFKL